jgi:hypothetical protein
MIVLNNNQALTSVCEQLGFSPLSFSSDRTTFMAFFVRRACSLYCPIPRGRLVKVVVTLLKDLLKDDPEQIKEEIKNAIEGLFAAGDLLELSRFKSFDDQYSGDWLFTSQPSFHAKSSGRVYICGIPKGDVSFLPLELKESVQFKGPYRYIPSCSPEDIASLKSLGLRDLPEEIWNPQPKRKNAQELIDFMNAKLSNATPPGVMKDILVLENESKQPGYYKQRWKPLLSQSGLFICRRPRGFGALGWIYAELNEGIVRRFIDLPFNSEIHRGCDWGWYTQLAKDSINGKPNTYKLDIDSGTNQAKVRFSFPIPSWAQRRFRMVENSSTGSPFEFIFPLQEWSDEKEFIENSLWFKHQN